MPKEIEPKPKIVTADFAQLFDMKRYFIVDLSGLVSTAQIKKPELLKAASEIDKEISASRVKALLRNEPVSLDHARAFVQAINKLLEAKGHKLQCLTDEDAVEGAFFLIDDFGPAISDRAVKISNLALMTRYPEKLIEGAAQGYRLTLSTALDLIRAANTLARPGSTPLDPLQVIQTDYRKGRKAAANGCIAHRGKYPEWPPEKLSTEDAV